MKRTLRFLPSGQNKPVETHDKIDDLIREACPDIFWTLKGVEKEKLPSLQHLALQRNIWARKRTSMANKRTMLAYIRTAFTLANMAKSWKEQSWSTFGIIFISCVAVEYIYNIITITSGIHPPKAVHMGFEYGFDAYAFGLVVVALIVLGYQVPE